LEFAAMYEAYRPLLFSIAYRMTGVVMEAEDLVQEVFLAVDSEALAAMEHPKSYLCRAITNRSLDYLRSARKRRNVYVGPWLPEPLVVRAADDPLQQVLLADEWSMAYLLLMESLTPMERAVLVLREAFAFEYDEVATIVSKSAANCRKLCSRAKQKLGTDMERSAARAETQAIEQQLLLNLMTAVQKGDIAGALAVLAPDVTLFSDGGGHVVAALRPVRTADHVIRFLFGLRSKSSIEPRVEFAAVNGGPGLLFYAGDQIDSVLCFHSVEGQITDLYIIRNPEKLRHLHVPISERRNDH